ncbi:MAG: DUF2817 domain-containing protein [Alphaproteobacteria bacterium]|nr:DUF2817 domain-containing protein [Alphaproteobacteria bacterium]
MTDFFSPTYAEARKRFLKAAGTAVVTSYAHPLKGPDGGDLATDLVRLGPKDARRVVVVESGTHGAEGFCGSAIQLSLLHEPPALPSVTAILLVHALNPHGYAWVRRVTEDNVDLNRNFLDFSKPLPENPGYDELKDALLPKQWNEASLAAARETLEAYRAKHGERAFVTGTGGGQYKHARGMFYGGTQPTWSNLTVEKICKEHLAGVPHAALVDIHSGLGPYGYGEPLTSLDPASAEASRARAWYGEELRNTRAADSAYAGTEASIITGYTRYAPWAAWTPIGLEFGTRSREQVRGALRHEHWLHAYGDPKGPDAPAIKAALKDVFCPDEPEWKEKVIARGREIVAKALSGIEKQ